ncbi:DASS family sodium-coupled anion symporter [Pseudoalteromonas sp. YIC-656]|uniref:SLC13 family permease n=1 Tax=Pseudoalteromonas pernae TaxID=3118054 RepID=UPI0032424A21
MTENIKADFQNTVRAKHQDIGIVLGPAFFAFMMLFDASQQTMSLEAWRTAAVGGWMAIWWATEAIPVPVTAFIPLAAFDFLGISSIKEAAAAYANPVIYLFLGAFILAAAVERWNLHKRIALLILSHTGTDGRRLIAGFMAIAALLSMWMTNTSTTMMLLPIGLSVTKVILDSVTGLTEKQRTDFQAAMLLSLAFGATIGGLATLIGTPPNALLAAYLSENHGIEIGFATWMMIGVPISLCMLPIAWFVLTHWIFKVDIVANDEAHSLLVKLKEQLGPMTSAEKRVAILFLGVVVLWMLRPILTAKLGLDGISDAGIAMAAAIIMFILPSGQKEQSQLLCWNDASRLPWGVLLLFGGGLSLASAVSSSGLAQWLGESLAPIGGMGVLLLIISATLLVIFLTELTSNLATTATFLPVMAAIALQQDLSPLALSVPITLAASCAFMLPVATPPNAIVYASGMLTIPQMIRAGFVLNIIGLGLLTVVAMWLAPWVLG